MHRLLMSVVVLCGLCATAFADKLPAGSLWTNGFGSQLLITSVDVNGMLQGTFRNYAEGFGCVGIKYPISGRTTAAITTFKVNFLECKKIITWRGTVHHGSIFPAPFSLEHNGQTTRAVDVFVLQD